MQFLNVAEPYLIITSSVDVAEEEPYHVAGAESERLRRAMYEEFDNDPTGSDEYGLRIRRFRDIRNRMQGIDPAGWVEVREATEEWFHIEKRLEEFTSVQAYLDVRKIHSGNKCVHRFTHFLSHCLMFYRYMAALIRWATGLHLNESELAIVEPTTDCVGIFLSLLNDYISWKRERDQPTDRIMNSVYVAMKNYNVDEEVAYDIIRGMLVKQEIKFLEMSEALRGRKGLSSGVRMYLQNLEYYAGGMFYWHILAPRYSKPQSFDPERED